MEQYQGLIANALSVLQIASIIIGGIIALWKVNGKMLNQTNEIKTLRNDITTNAAVWKDKFVMMERELGKLSEALLQLAKQEARMDAIDVRLQELSNRLSNGPRSTRK